VSETPATQHSRREEETMFFANCDGERKRPRHGGLVFGGALVIMGAGFLLHHLGLLGGLRPWQVWPAIPIWAGLLNLFGGHGHGARIWGFIQIVVGAAVGAFYLGYMPLQWNLVWPVLLIGLGLVIVFGGACRRRQRGRVDGSASSASTLDVKAVFSGREERIDAQDFRGGRVRCKFGGYKLDLTRAEIEGDEAVLDVDLWMGGLEVFVPRRWRIRTEVSPVMGGVEDKTRQDDPGPNAKRLVVRGSVVMGGVEIKN
jgi:hypothetical protein